MGVGNGCEFLCKDMINIVASCDGSYPDCYGFLSLSSTLFIDTTDKVVRYSCSDKGQCVSRGVYPANSGVSEFNRLYLRLLLAGI
jgi:hypothetical protein